MTPETVNSYFTPLHYILYLGVLFVGVVVYNMWKWSKDCSQNVQVCVVKSDGQADYVLTPKSGGYVSLTNPTTGSVRLWPINRMCAVNVPYPGTGLVPRFLQKQIWQVVVDEEDWEPILNRSPHRKKVMSPDVVAVLKELLANTKDTDVVETITWLLEDAQTAPTREMIANPAVLGNLIEERITQAVMTINKDMLDSLGGLTRKLGNMLNPMHFYIGIGAVMAVGIFTAYQVSQLDIESLQGLQAAAGDIAAIKASLGVK